MSKRTRLYAAAMDAARSGTPGVEAAVAAYVEHARRGTWGQRAWDWYMRLPHNRRVFLPLFAWANRHPRIAVPAGLFILGAEVVVVLTR